MWTEAANTSSFTSLSHQHEQASHTNKDFEMLVLKNKINSHYCQILIWALISILILPSQDTAAHVSSPQESTTAVYQYIMDIGTSGQSAWWNKYAGNTSSSSHTMKAAYFLVEENSQWFSRKTANYIKLVLNTLRMMTFQVNSALIVTWHMKVSLSINSCIFPRFIRYILYVGDTPLVTSIQ